MILHNQLRAIDREIFDYIKAFIQKNSLSPRLGDIRNATKTTSRGACISLGRLVAAGKIEFEIDNENGLQIVLIENPMKKALIGFAGFGGPDIALREAGFQTVGIEIDAAIAEVNRFNGGNVITADILGVDPGDYTDCFLTHFSPPCPSYSVARSAKSKQDIYSRISDLAYHQSLVNGESEWDIRLARKICEFIRVVRPKYFTLENVWGYRNSRSWLLIWYTLLEEGYGVDAWNLNAADYGVPQSRRRMIVIARRDGRQPARPWPTHSKTGDMFTEPWVGWYEAVEDLIPDLPESQFAPWQRDRLPEEWKTFLLMTGNTNRAGDDNKPGRGCLSKCQPANTVSGGPKGGALPKALLIPGDNSSNGVIRDADSPMVTVMTRPPSRCPHRAFILGQGERSSPKPATAPAYTVTGNNNQTGVKALIMDSANSGSNNGKGNMRCEADPIFTVTAQEKTAPPKAFIVDCQNNGPPERRGLTMRQEDQPIFTMTASANRRPVRAGLPQGRVIEMTPRALARFQQFPDDFVLPGDGDPKLDGNIALSSDPRSLRELACRGIGNALPPGLYRAVLKSLNII